MNAQAIDLRVLRVAASAADGMDVVGSGTSCGGVGVSITLRRLEETRGVELRKSLSATL